MTEYISVEWIDKDTKETIFEDCMSREEFKKIHGVSAHIGASGVIIHDARVRAGE